jgi:hypothetical protein
MDPDGNTPVAARNADKLDSMPLYSAIEPLDLFDEFFTGIEIRPQVEPQPDR